MDRSGEVWIREALDRAPIIEAPVTREVAFASRSLKARHRDQAEGFLEAYAHVAGDVVVRGNLVPDAHVAAILFQHGVRTLYSNDRDFLKFTSLDVRDPFA